MMTMNPRQINYFLLFKLPAAFFTGVRVKSIDRSSCSTTVRHRWINQNPFNSMFWAVQGMAAELSTGALVMQAIKQCGQPVSMLVLKNEASFYKKARGRITFSCDEGSKLTQVLDQALTSDEGIVCRLRSVGTDAQGDKVCEFYFDWTLKRRPKDQKGVKKNKK
jgi:hypothetical protein